VGNLRVDECEHNGSVISSAKSTRREISSDPMDSLSLYTGRPPGLAIDNVAIPTTVIASTPLLQIGREGRTSYLPRASFLEQEFVWFGFADTSA
jgi:hypothetical protein